MPQHELQRLLPRHFQILELCLQGYSTKDIAQAVSLTPQAISLITNSPLFQDALARRRSERQAIGDEEAVQAEVEALDLLRKHSKDAAQVQVDLLEAPDGRVALVSANSILDRVLGKAPPEAQSSAPVMVLAENIQILQVALKESRDARDGSISTSSPT